MSEEQDEFLYEHELLSLLQQISLAVAEANEINSAYERVLGLICTFMDWPLGHAYVWSEKDNALISSRVWYLADASTIQPFRRLSEATQFRPGEGTLGLVWESGESISILDVRDEPVFVRKMPVEEGGIRAYFAFPVLVEGKVIAVLEFFSPRSAAPDQDMTSIINHVSALLGLAMRRQQTLHLLQESEAQLAEAQRTAHLGHWEWDLVSKQIYFSPELYRILGLFSETSGIKSEDVLNFIPPDDQSFVREKVEAAYKRGIPFDYFHRITRTDGVERVIHSRGRPIFDESGKIVKLYGTAQDMTKQKETELQLAQTVRQLSTLMEIGQTISATLEPDVVYDQVLTLVRPIIGAEALFLFLYEPQADELVIAALDQENIPNMRGLKVSADSGIVGEVWQTGISVFLRDEGCVQKLSPVLLKLSGYQPEAMLAVPVRWRDTAVGVMEAVHRDKNAFSEDALRILETAAAWIAISINNTDQYEKLKRRLQESNAILAISNALTETLDLDELLKIIVDHAQDIISHADWTTIHLLHPQTNRLELAVSAGLEINPDEYMINFGEGIAGQVMVDGGVLNVKDVQADPRRLPIDLSTGAQSLLVAPVESRQRRIGTISVQCARPGGFTDDDEHLLTILGVQAGMAIENANLFRTQQKARWVAEKQRERMRKLAQIVVQAQEAERARIARELHDESGQSLTSLKISLDLIRSALPEELADIKESLDELLALTDKTMSNLRLLSHNLRPPGLDAYGLNAALEGLCQDFQSHTDLPVIYSGEEIPDLASLVALSLYRFAQEALTNAAKHAGASEIQVTLSQDADRVTLMVADNGIGFSIPDLEKMTPTEGAGLIGMVERLEMVEGHLDIESEPGRGSCLRAEVPYYKEGT